MTNAGNAKPSRLNPPAVAVPALIVPSPLMPDPGAGTVPPSCTMRAPTFAMLSFSNGIIEANACAEARPSLNLGS